MTKCNFRSLVILCQENQSKGDVMRIFCLMVSGMPLSAYASLFLMEQACALAQSGKSKDFFMAEQFDGMISTEGKYGMLGSHAKGTIFSATIESDAGKTVVNFLADVPFAQKVFKEDLSWTANNFAGEELSSGTGRKVDIRQERCYNA